jgi:uncharacterized protein (DUF433 family)
MATHERISIDPAVMVGKPVIKGTRITVELILWKLSQGASEEDLIEAYPSLRPGDVRAAIAYAADVVAHEIIVTAPVTP